ncbi:hypothetical protein FKM82_003290 [Ascaphus truei]
MAVPPDEYRYVATGSGETVSDQGKHTLVPEEENVEKMSSYNHIPKMRYSVGYDRQAAELCVSFLEAVASSLPGDQDSGSHCYVLGTLTTSRGQTEAQTALVKRAPHTVWEEALLFPLQEEERSEATLTLTLRHCDRFSRHQVAGEITPSLANIGVPFGTARWVDLRVPEKVSRTLVLEELVTSPLSSMSAISASGDSVIAMFILITIRVESGKQKSIKLLLEVRIHYTT